MYFKEFFLMCFLTVPSEIIENYSENFVNKNVWERKYKGIVICIWKISSPFFQSLKAIHAQKRHQFSGVSDQKSYVHMESKLHLGNKQIVRNMKLIGGIISGIYVEKSFQCCKIPKIFNKALDFGTALWENHSFRKLLIYFLVS